jgi:4-nitrophenyl phosphatase
MYQGYLIDLDGTVYHGKQPIPSAITFIQRLYRAGIPFLFLTNNSSRTPEQFVALLRGMNLPFVQVDHIYSSSMAAADWIGENRKSGRDKVYVIGEEGLQNAICAKGLELVDSNPDYVVVGIDRDFSYQKMSVAVRAIMAGARFVATNPDRLFPVENGFVPGNGSLCAAIQYATNQPPVWIGKPSPIMVEHSIRKLGKRKEEVVLVGDNLETDIQAGAAAGIDTVMVLTGVSREEDLETSSIQPTYLLRTLTDWAI